MWLICHPSNICENWNLGLSLRPWLQLKLLIALFCNSFLVDKGNLWTGCRWSSDTNGGIERIEGASLHFESKSQLYWGYMLLYLTKHVFLHRVLV